MGPGPAVAEVRRAVRLVLESVVDQAVLVACSGGADSVALAAAVAFEAPKLKLSYGLITIDHGLQDESSKQAQRVADLGYELGFDPVEIVTVEVAGPGGPEAAARVARYAALDATATALDAVVLLGHTLDDQAETVLLGLGRGSGPRSVAGMRERSGRYLRPLLGVRRSTTEAACAALGLDTWDDPQNVDPSFQRVRLRREVIPLLEEVLQGGVVEALARTAELLRDDLDLLDALAATEFGSAAHSATILDIAEIGALPRSVRTRVLRTWALGLGASEVSAERTAALDALVSDWHGQGAVQLPGGVSVLRTSGRLEGHRPADQPAPTGE